MGHADWRGLGLRGRRAYADGPVRNDRRLPVGIDCWGRAGALPSAAGNRMANLASRLGYDRARCIDDAVPAVVGSRRQKRLRICRRFLAAPILSIGPLEARNSASVSMGWRSTCNHRVRRAVSSCRLGGCVRLLYSNLPNCGQRWTDLSSLVVARAFPHPRSVRVASGDFEVLVAQMAARDGEID